jgi:DNA mismatch repair ATPase MutS
MCLLKVRPFSFPSTGNEAEYFCIGTMLIDADSARNLELVQNMTHKKSSHTLYGAWTFR